MHRFEVKVNSATTGEKSTFVMLGTSLRAVPKLAARREYGDRARFIQSGTTVELQEDGWYRAAGVVIYRKVRNRFSDPFTDKYENVVIEVRKSRNKETPGTTAH
jgi:hypothetical protein